MDFGCPICGVEANKDCLDDCEGVEAPPQVWGFVEEQLAYVTHKVSRRLMKEFKMKLFTDKLDNEGFSPLRNCRKYFIHGLS